MKTKIIRLQGMEISPSRFNIWAGPCAVENEKQFLKTAEFLKTQGVKVLRAGIFKPRASSDSFQGLGKTALPFIQKIKKKLQLLTVSEITDPRQIELLDPAVDIYQVGTRNMYNYELLKELGKTDKPILLKRAFSATITEWLQATGYILQGGNNKIILCERGIRTFETKHEHTGPKRCRFFEKRKLFSCVCRPFSWDRTLSLSFPYESSGCRRRGRRAFN